MTNTGREPLDSCVMETESFMLTPFLEVNVCLPVQWMRQVVTVTEDFSCKAVPGTFDWKEVRLFDGIYIDKRRIDFVYPYGHSAIRVVFETLMKAYGVEYAKPNEDEGWERASNFFVYYCDNKALRVKVDPTYLFGDHLPVSLYNISEDLRLALRCRLENGKFYGVSEQCLRHLLEGSATTAERAAGYAAWLYHQGKLGKRNFHQLTSTIYELCAS